VTAPRQPLLHDSLVVLRAPTQVWSAPDGHLHAFGIHGVYHSDVRVVRALTVTVDGLAPEHIATDARHADRVRVESLLRQLDDEHPDPGVQLSIDRRVDATGVSDEVVIRQRRGPSRTVDLTITLELDATVMEIIKQGRESTVRIVPTLSTTPAQATWAGESVTACLTAQGLELHADPGRLTMTAALALPAGGEARVSWRLDVTDAIAPVGGATGAIPWSAPVLASDDPRLERWVDRSLADLAALRMTLADDPTSQFLAAGAPWFFTLFGRDSLWAARLLLPLGTELAAGTLRVLARLQGQRSTVATAEEPGRIMHELRRQYLVVDARTTLPPLYYGSVDATPLWICLLHDAWRAGMPESEVRALLPALHAALNWLRDHGDADGDGLLEYVDRSGHGLANQGWKDSGDSIQWHDGTLADGPIALCEVQAYAYEAARGGADLLEALGDADAEQWREWAERLRGRFHESFWITDATRTGELGPYPAVALDGDKRPVDSVTSNLGHLLGTGILTAQQSALIAGRLVHASLNSGYGLRTLSSEAAGYWPLSYHGGSVWAHDTAIAIRGLRRAGHEEQAAMLARGLLDAAEAFAYRMPELHSGDPAPGPVVPYPAACRPQAWSAAAAITVAEALGALPGV
jgi:hypothetical protein